MKISSSVVCSESIRMSPILASTVVGRLVLDAERINESGRRAGRRARRDKHRERRAALPTNRMKRFLVLGLAFAAAAAVLAPSAELVASEDSVVDDSPLTLVTVEADAAF